MVRHEAEKMLRSRCDWRKGGQLSFTYCRPPRCHPWAHFSATHPHIPGQHADPYRLLHFPLSQRPAIPTLIARPLFFYFF